jgi:hypothetical protein
MPRLALRTQTGDTKANDAERYHQSNHSPKGGTNMGKQVSRQKTKTPNPKAPVTRKDLTLLRDAIEDTKSLKGSLMPADWPEHEAYTNEMEVALARVKYQGELFKLLATAVEASDINHCVCGNIKRLVREYYEAT